MAAAAVPGPGPVEAAAPGDEAAGAGPLGSGPARLARLPLARVKALVKADPDVTLASQEAVFVLARATKVPWEPLVWSRSPENVAFEEPTFLAFSFIACPVHLCAAISSALFRPVYWEQELFVETIAKDAYVYAQQGKRKTLQRKDLDNAIEAIDEFAFLEDGLFCVPPKFSTALVKNPHGEEVVQILENCKIKEKCYHVSQVEYYYEIVQSSAGRREKQLKLVPYGEPMQPSQDAGKELVANTPVSPIALGVPGEPSSFPLVYWG
ncbi:hypothetical protein DUI87_22467 [Hirundo rustica rustica]|uniref:Transcription factor CBF/NF-Y/archaeal histone domain-containing protein n=1 Tax=Hirundo rustica rustica TaxID=333673 RepID=A0A3M0JIP5_HIRRU|nr:hypothetical protein DUI87_22467 [Hirundo rustica rustica]